MQVYVDFFAIAVLLLGGALASYGEQLHFNSHFLLPFPAHCFYFS